MNLKSLLILLLTTNGINADNHLYEKMQKQRISLENIQYPLIAKVKTHNENDMLTLSNEFDCMDRVKNTQNTEGRKDYLNIMIHGDKELNHLTQYSQVSEIDLDEEWTFELQRKAALATSSGYSFKTMSGSSTSNEYESISQYFACFRDLKSSLQTLRDVEASYPHLAEVIDIGDSYLNQYDILVIKLTNKYKELEGNATKAKMFAMFGIHAREYAPPELGARFIEKLVENYGLDADITTILDTSEIHIVLQANPDGREIAEKYPHFYRRKNMNREYGGSDCDDFAYGVDLNRNFPFKWSTEGASSDPCSETYHGPFPASEPEVQAIVNYMDTIFENGTKTGTFFDVHAYGRLDIWPYTYEQGAISPDNDYFVNLAEKFDAMNGHILSGPGQPEFIGVASGASLDFAYGTVSLMAHALEIGDDFYQDCDVFESDISPRNMDVLLYGAKITWDPFLLPMGPDVGTISLSNDYVTSDSTVCLTASFKLNAYIQSDTTIESIVVKIDNDIINGITLPVDNSISTGDNTFNLLLSLADMDVGKHTLHIQGIDSVGYTGPMSSIFFVICDSTNDDGCISVDDTCEN